MAPFAYYINKTAANKKAAAMKIYKVKQLYDKCSCQTYIYVS